MSDYKRRLDTTGNRKLEGPKPVFLKKRSYESLQFRKHL